MSQKAADIAGVMIAVAVIAGVALFGTAAIVAASHV